jgi:hypothetical protein
VPCAPYIGVTSIQPIHARGHPEAMRRTHVNA